ncbi:unnamed protein product [Microthlaspi erraticum]|uniref:Uncharacterized protein n=1 Tax=Microthlaspi erraticum TaxID=1685480 RepID=A0A6D2KU98_9BRAS|nr:unnamed protein product [Microthlaspi erraticum]
MFIRSCPYDHAMGGVQTEMPAVGSVVYGSCDTNMVIGGPNDVDGNRDSDRQQSMDVIVLLALALAFYIISQLHVYFNLNMSIH